MLKVFHKAACITCKKAIAELERIRSDLDKRDFFKDPLSEAELRKIVRMTGKRPSELLRKRDRMYKELDLENDKKTDAQIIRLMARHPGLILRPIVIYKDRVFVGKIDAEKMT